MEAHVLQMALLLLPHKIKLYNITAKCEEPESLSIKTAGKQWLVTPNGAALLSVHCTVPENHTETNGRWVMDVFALEQCLPEQHLFDRIAINMALPEKISHLPSKARSPCLYLNDLVTIFPAFASCHVFWWQALTE
jgi:hypothetical protein